MMAKSGGWKKENHMSLSRRAAQVQEALDQFGIALQVIELPDSTRTAEEAAAAVGCAVGQIAKSLIIRRSSSDLPVLVIASGNHRVDLPFLSERLDDTLEMADADFVRQATGYAIGGVPPVGHTQSIETYIDEQLFDYVEIWAAAGTPRAVFSLTPEQLQEVTQGQRIPVIRG
jgi:prolyl-tRNA editing enzyme YbaK/EbsC (Cys-tRNA(Pro) deacylase)